MRKIRRFLLLIVVVAALWHFYGESFKQDGVQGVYEEVSSDIIEIKENPQVIQVVNQLNHQIQRFVGMLDETIQENKQADETEPEKPQLDAPADQAFSIHNIELGDDRSEVEQQAGSPQRSSFNDYGVEWDAYHEDYHNFFMVAYNQENKVAGLYTNQDLLSSVHDIDFESSRDSVLSNLNEPLKSIRKGFVNYQIKNNQEYDTFLLDDAYVTLFYDKHEKNTVTAIQIIDADLEVQKTNYFAEPNDELRVGFEYQLFDLTNAARVKHDLPTLTWNDSVKVTARDHSADMAANNYFSHTNLEGQSPFDRMREDNISFRTAGENLASGQPSSIFAHQGLMNSLGHRENILKLEFKQLGVGVAFNENAQPFFTENFLTK